MTSKVEKRRNELVSIINVDGKSFISEAAKLFNVTHETIRNDFDYLVKTHGFKRIHGGIKKDKHQTYQKQYDYHHKKTFHVEEKKRICYKMIDQIKDGDCIYIDGGSTVLYLLNYMNKLSNITLVTPSIPLLIKYMMEGFEKVFNDQGHELLFVGGKIHTKMQTTYGTFFDQMISDVHFDKMILSSDAIDLKGGITNTDEVAYAIVKRVSDQAKQKYVLIDKSKFGRIAKYKSLSFSEVDFIISDFESDVLWTEKMVHENIFYIKA